MPIPEEVDEINEYLKARRKKQELGELPRQDLTPSFIKRMGTALFGEKAKPKVPLQSTQPTYASPTAQSAVRKQLDEIMQERAPKSTTPAPTPITRAPTPSAPRPLPPIPRYPESNVWASAAKPAPTLPPRSTTTVRAPAPAPISNARPSPSGWGFWNKTPALKTTTPTHTPRAQTPSSSPTSSPITRANPVNAPAPPTAPPTAFPSYASIAATPPKPYTDIPPLPKKGVESPPAKAFDPIPSMRTAPAPPTPSPMNSSSPVRAESTPPAPSARSAYAPPWVTRTIPKPGITPALNTKQQQIASTSSTVLEIAPSASPKKNDSTPQSSSVIIDGKKSPRVPAPSSRGRPWVTGVLPKEAGENFTPARITPLSSPNADEPYARYPSQEGRSPSVPISSSRPGSGEVHVDELVRGTRPAQPLPTPTPASRDTALNEEISEEEAIDRLPFEEVEGLSESDLAYLERKEKEHAQTHEEELDQVDPAALKAHLEEQSQKLQAQSPTPAGEDPKKEILRRLKKMMEETPHSP